MLIKYHASKWASNNSPISAFSRINDTHHNLYKSPLLIKVWL